MTQIFREEDAELLTFSPTTSGRLLADGDTTGGSISAGRLSLGAGVEGGKPHYHARSTEIFYVVDGELEIMLDDQLERVGKGGLVVVPPLMPHAFGAAAGSHADLLVAITPGVQRFDYLRHLARVAAGDIPAGYVAPDPSRYDVWPVERPLWGTTR
ncbi:cupin domain-containing protein [Allokutzneria sp. A3M-2-11 16]|uniref:cupin domain-containing protein n=1 Tax=Allokutzneria sp. A3M-2-11 16 TaxID=2962043 RepID=UPI0020B7E08A|nr:cupin domain-containing protein [Allokutzneria sp. A3M-2-11 16]MCP3804457.1 cupin domain-containing protein [Allokutzneria sp. A3M-2-11 16]